MRPHRQADKVAVYSVHTVNGPSLTRIRCVSKFAAGSRGSPCDSTAFLYIGLYRYAYCGSTCAAGLKNLSAASEQVASDRRARRHAASQATPAGPACPQCGRICMCFRLWSPHSAVIFAAIVDRETDTPAVQRRGRNRPTTTSKHCGVVQYLQLQAMA